MNTQKRDAVIALCGIVAGIMVGAATFLTQDDLRASIIEGGVSTPAAGIDVMPRGEALRRARPSWVSSAPSASASSSSRSSAAVEMPTPLHDCVLAKGISDNFIRAVNQFVEENAYNTGVRAGLTKVAQNAIDAYCPASLFPSSSSSARPKVNNLCEQYGIYTARYASCRAMEQLGIPYIDPVSR